MKILPLIFLSFSLNLLFNCNNVENKKTLLIAYQNFSEFKSINRKFEIYSDSTFQFTESVRDTDHQSDEKWTGKLEILKDTIKFKPFELKYNRSKTAVLKNGFIEFIDGEEPDRMKIEKTSLTVKNKLDINKFPNYSVFTFYKKFNNQEWQKEYSNYDLNNQDLLKIDEIFRNEFSKNKKLRNFNDYLKQIVAIKNAKNEIIIQAHFFCKQSSLIESYQYYETSMHDGGNCNVYLELNLSTSKFTFINIAGIA